MLALTKKTDYALIALSFLANRPGKVVSAREIAGISGVPLPILTNTLKSLSHAGIVASERGSRGGYTLAKPADQVSLDELITAIEGPIHFVRCMLSDGETAQSPCIMEPSCPVRLPAHRIYDRLKQFLKSITLAELGVEESAHHQFRQINIEPVAASVEQLRERQSVATELVT